ncbi:unannotated protein [freshwater metagenome]|uniref:Unannotated protein n=1 Tax=freshwater metagenome TaxID=449393 RepID=A0A6J6SHG8_9ZZZZ
MLVGDVTDAALEGLETLSVHFLGDDLGTAHLKLVALTTHRLDEHRKLQLAAPGNFNDVGRLGLVQPDRDVAEHLSLEALPEVAAREELALASGHRRGVHAERHIEHRLVNGKARQRHRVLDGGDGVADLDLREAADDEEVACVDLVCIGPADTGELHERGQFALEGRLSLAKLLLEEGNHLTTTQYSVVDATDGEASEVFRGVEVGHECLQRRRGVSGRLGDTTDDGIEQRRQVVVLSRHTDPNHRAPLTGHGGDDLEVDVFVACVEVDEQLVDLVEDFLRPGVVTINLVDDHDGGQIGHQSLLQHVPGLGKGALSSINEEQYAVHHREGSLDLPTEIGVAGRVNQIDLDTLPVHRGGLGQDGDAALALLVVRVHDPVDDCLVRCEGTGGAQKRIHECRLAVIDVRDEGNVTEGSSGHEKGDHLRLIGGSVTAECGRSGQSASASSESSSSSKVTPYFSARAAYLSSSELGSRSELPSPRSKAPGPACFNFRASSKRR